MKSTPQAARKLLHLFACGLLVAVFASSFVYLRAVFNEEVSQRRSVMNEAVFNAQDFFVSRQTLLKSLVLATVPDTALSQTPDSVDPLEEIKISLGSEAGHWSLWLTRRMMDYLYESKVNLLYVPPADQPQVVRLFDASPGLDPLLPRVVLQRLAEEGDRAYSFDDDLWLTDNKVLDSPFYLFARLDSRNLSSGWLGIEVEVPDLIEALRSDSAGDFMLLDAQGQIIFTNAAQSTLVDSLHALEARNSFGFIGSGWLPDSLAIRKKLGYSGWQIVYAVDIKSLLPVLGWPLAVCVLLFIAVCIGLRFLIVRIDRRLITPGENRIQALVESEAFSRAALQVAPVALCVIRRTDGTVVLENSLSQQWLGRSSERGKLCHGWIHRAFDESELSNSDEIEMEDGRLLYLAFAPTRYKSEDVLICAFSDISARKQIEVTLERARQLADRANEAKTLFLATMSHEIRTPLYGVLGNLELLELTPLNERQHEYLKTIQRSSAVLFQLISDVLDVSKIESGQMAVQAQAFCPLDLLEDCVRSYSAAASNKGLKLFACADANLPPLVCGDAVRIRQIINNLLSNAIKFTDSGRVVLRLKVTAIEPDHVSLQWQVSDTGIGISEQQLTRLFKPFSQVGGSERAGGAGLGLSICSRLSEMMGANLRVVSEPGLGSSFSLQMSLPVIAGALLNSADIDLRNVNIHVRAPLKDIGQSLVDWLCAWGARAQLLPVSEAEDRDAILLDIVTGSTQSQQAAGERVIATVSGRSQAQRTARGWEVNAYDIRAIARTLMQVAQGTAPQLSATVPQPQASLELNVLVAEDNPVNREILKEQLEALGVRVTLAEDGEQALVRWSEGSFDLVITDVNMPRLDGYQLTRRLRELDPAVPIIGVTANAMREEGEHCLEVGMNAWLVKPLSLSTLRQTLCAYCPQTTQASAPVLESATRAEPADDLEGWITLSPAMHRLFISTMQEDLAQAGLALQQGDTSKLVSYVHRMNGSFATVCAVNLAAACNECEIALLRESLNPESAVAIKALLKRLHGVVARMVEGELYPEG